MNKVPLIIFFCIFISCIPKDLPPSERSSTELDQADRVILVTSESSIKKRVVQHLIDMGFTIDIKRDNEILTKAKSYTKGLNTDNLLINVLFNNNEIIFIGKTGTDFFGYKEVDNSKGELKRGWNRLKEIALKFPHDQVYYERR